MLTPFENFTASVDYYTIGISNRIVLSSNFATTNVAAFLATQGYPGIEGGRYFTNGVDTRTNGVDVTGSYGFKLSNGDKFSLGGGYNYNDTRVTYAKATPANVLALTGGTVIFDRQSTLRRTNAARRSTRSSSPAPTASTASTFLVREDWYGKVLQRAPPATESPTSRRRPTRSSAPSG